MPELRGEQDEGLPKHRQVIGHVPGEDDGVVRVLGVAQTPHPLHVLLEVGVNIAHDEHSGHHGRRCGFVLGGALSLRGRRALSGVLPSGVRAAEASSSAWLRRTRIYPCASRCARGCRQASLHGEGRPGRRGGAATLCRNLGNSDFITDFRKICSGSRSQRRRPAALGGGSKRCRRASPRDHGRQTSQTGDAVVELAPRGGNDAWPFAPRRRAPVTIRAMSRRGTPGLTWGPRATDGAPTGSLRPRRRPRLCPRSTHRNLGSKSTRSPRRRAGQRWQPRASSPR